MFVNIIKNKRITGTSVAVFSGFRLKGANNLNNNVLAFSVNVVGPEDEVKQTLNDGGVTTFPSSNGIAFAYDSNDMDTYNELSDLADDGATVSHFTLGILNVDDGSFYPSQELTEKLAEANGAEADDLDFSILPDMPDFVDGAETEIEQAKHDVAEKYYAYLLNDDNKNNGSASAGSMVQSVDNNENDPVYNASTGKFVAEPADNAESADEPTAEPVPAESDDDGFDLDDDTDFDLDNYNDTTDTTDELPSSPAPTAPVQQGPVFQPMPDELLKVAAQMFTNIDRSELPVFDPHTQKQLQKQIIEAETTIDRDRNKAVQRIWERLQQVKPGIEKSFDAHFKDSNDRHGEVLKQIDANEAVAIADAKKTKQENYERARDQYVADQRQALQDRYDAEHRENFNATLNADVEQIKTSNEALRHQENHKFDEFRAKELDKYRDDELRKTNIDDIVSDFNAEVNAQVDMLKDSAGQFADQVGVVAADLDNQLKSSQEETAEWKHNFKNLQSTYNEKLNLEVEKQVNDRTTVLSDRVNMYNSELKSREQELNTVKQALEGERTRNGELSNAAKELANKREEMAKLKQELETERAKNENIDKTLEHLQNQLKNQSYNAFPQQPAAPIIPAPQSSQPAPQPTQTEKKGHAGAIASMVMGALAIAGLSVGGTMLAVGHNGSSSDNSSSSVRTEQTSTSSASSSQPSVSDSVKTYKKGDTWTYHNGSDNQNYTVTMDSDSTGHYTDKNGQQHTVTLNANNN